MMPWRRRAARRSQLRRGPHGVPELRLGVRHPDRLDETGRELVDPACAAASAARRGKSSSPTPRRSATTGDCMRLRVPSIASSGRRWPERPRRCDRARARPGRRRRFRPLTMAGTTTQERPTRFRRSRPSASTGTSRAPGSRPMGSARSTTRSAVDRIVRALVVAGLEHAVELGPPGDGGDGFGVNEGQGGQM